MVIILFNFKSYNSHTIWHCKHDAQILFVITREWYFKMHKNIFKSKVKIYFYYECELFLSTFPKVTELWRALPTRCGE